MGPVNIVSSFTFIFMIVITIFFESESKRVEDTLKTDADWVFLTRFCFLSKIGNLNYDLEYPVGYGVQSFAFYYDIPGQWSSVYQRDLTCTEKVDALKGRNQFKLDDTTSHCGQFMGVEPLNATQFREKRTGQDWYVCKGDLDFSTARERWWFIVLTRCGPPVNSTYKGMYLNYKLHMTNGDTLLQKEFSADEFYILVIDIVFFILYIILLLLAVVCSGRILQTCSNIVFILMLILLAKGYTVVRVRLTTKAIIKITVFINLYIVAMVVMFIWEGALFDPGLVLYYYESPPGYGMITVILIGWLWFTKAAVFTLKHYSKKTLFYVAFYTFYTICPFVVLIAMFAMAKWTREKTVNGVQQFIAFLAHVVFLILTLPHKANENFPYHIRTTQIGSMNDGSEYTEPNNLYENTYRDSFTGVGPNLDIFITSSSYSESSNGDRLYIPLESSSTGSSVSILSRMQQASLPPISNKTTENGNQNIPNGVSNHNSIPDHLNKASWESEGRKPMKLPPLQEALSDSSRKGDHVTLPPIRASGLPPLVPSAPSNDSDNDKASLSRRASLFQVS
ncbi:unnamed protein product [Candidula unifasciata]|uniref:Intimal thickness related receptor IRP domain-containing protein n=1 Tax=Candidula unifasciata TaxID=100452 RepID=A0A8S3Z0N2_9EUPU|nr:unnamed protein product [Candidula unifasciata]